MAKKTANDKQNSACATPWVRFLVAGEIRKHTILNSAEITAFSQQGPSLQSAGVESGTDSGGTDS